MFQRKSKEWVFGPKIAEGPQLSKVGGALWNNATYTQHG